MASNSTQTQSDADRFHYVTWDGRFPVRPDDLLGECITYVYVTRSNKAVCWEFFDDPCAYAARYLPKDPEQLFSPERKRGAVAEKDIRETSGNISEADRDEMLHAYYGENTLPHILRILRLVSSSKSNRPDAEPQIKPAAFIYETGDTMKRPCGAVYKTPQTGELVFIPLAETNELAIEHARFFTSCTPKVFSSPEEKPNFQPESKISTLGEEAYPEHRAWLTRAALDWGCKEKRKQYLLQSLALK